MTRQMAMDQRTKTHWHVRTKLHGSESLPPFIIIVTITIIIIIIVIEMKFMLEIQGSKGADRKEKGHLYTTASRSSTQ